MKDALPDRVRFGVFELDIRRGELREGDRTIPLQEQPLQILLMLVERGGEIATREEIQKKLWPNGTVVEFDQSINAAIKKLRKALDDPADEPKYIKTIARHGYRLMVPVEREANSGDEGSGRGQARGRGELSVLRQRKWLAIAATVGVAMISGLVYSHSHKPSELNAKDTIVLADFDNKTGDAIFDGTLTQALAIELEQSPFLNVLPENKIKKTLKLMNRPSNEPLTREVARELCLRNNGTGLLTGTIVSVGDHYLVGLRAANCQTGETLASAEAEAENRNHVLQAVGGVADRVRERLGESLASVQAFNRPLEEATTSSLEALQAYTQGTAILSDEDALPYYQRAVHLDPNFAMAYAAMGEAYQFDETLRTKYIKRAYDLRDRVSLRERFKIEADYYDNVTGEAEKAIRTYIDWVRNYPGDYVPHEGLAADYAALGQMEKAAFEAQEMVRLRPGVASYKPLIYSYMALNRLEDARTALVEAKARGLDTLPPIRQTSYYLAFLQGDIASMNEQVTWAMGRPDAEPFFLQTQSANEFYHGRVSSARQLSQRAQESALRAGRKELPAYMKVSRAPDEAEIGNMSLARRLAEDASALRHGNNADIDAPVALTMAIAGEVGRAQVLVERIDRDSPLDTLTQTYELPCIRAAIEMALNNPGKAIEILQVAAPYELGDRSYPPMGVYPAYVRGLAYLKLGQGQRAAAEFEKVVAHPGIAKLHVHGALAHLQLGRAQAMAGDKAAARKSYQSFLTLWKDADADIPIYKQAKAEYAKLQ